MLAIGVIGCGAIGSEICRAIDTEQMQAMLAGVADVDARRAASLAGSLRRVVPVLSPPDVIASSDLVVEATSKAAAPAIIRESLTSSRDVMVLSVGALLDGSAELVALAATYGRRIYVPSGAIASLDGVKGAMVGRLSRVRLTTRKPPRALEGSPYVGQHVLDLGRLTEPTLIFSGSAREAVSAFPANTNVAAALSLVGIGPDRTEIQIVADPSLDRNVHEIEAEGDFGRLVARIENVPSPTNPKTSYMAALSAIAMLRQITSPLVVGT